MLDRSASNGSATSSVSGCFQPHSQRRAPTGSPGARTVTARVQRYGALRSFGRRSLLLPSNLERDFSRIQSLFATRRLEQCICFRARRVSALNMSGRNLVPTGNGIRQLAFVAKTIRRRDGCRRERKGQVCRPSVTAAVWVGWMRGNVDIQDVLARDRVREVICTSQAAVKMSE